MIYIVGLFFLLFISIIIKKKNDGLFLLISGIFLILLMSLRSYNVGSDSFNYYNLFCVTAQGGVTVLIQKAPLFYMIMKVFGTLFGGFPQIYFIITALLVIIPLWLGIYISKVPCRKAVLLYYLLFFQTSLNGTRTYISVAFVFLAYTLARKKETKDYVLSGILLVAAFFIHKIAIIGIPIIAISFLNLEKRILRRIVLAITAISCLLLNLFIRLFMKFFNVYEDTLEIVTDTVGASAVVFQLLMIFSLLNAFYLIKKRKDARAIIKKEDYDNISVLIFSEVVLYIAGGTTWYVQRILSFLNIFIILLFPVMVKIKSKYRQVYIICTYIIAVFYFAYGLVRNLNDVMPYTFFWQ